MRRPALLAAVLLAACTTPPEAGPDALQRMEVDLLELDDAVARYTAATGALPPDIGTTLIQGGYLDRVRSDPYSSGQTFDGIVTYGYTTGYDEAEGEFYVLYSVGPDGTMSFLHDPKAHRILARGDDEIQTNLFVE